VINRRVEKWVKMTVRDILVYIILSIILGTGCAKTDSAPTQIQNPPTRIEKSPKRGIAYDLTDPADLDTLKAGVSWWYNWYFQTGAGTGYYARYQMEFIPMLWGGNSSDADMIKVRDFILNHSEIKYLLVMNEPNLTDQANRTPAQAAADWLKYEMVIKELAAHQRAVYLVGPAMTWGTMADYWDPVVWLDSFIETYRLANGGRYPQIDYLAFHWYDYGLEEQLDRLEKYGKKIWITEMANWNAQIDSYQKQAQQMQQMVSACESRDDVFRYAWFIGRGAEDKYSNLFNTDPGDLNDLGKLYMSLPYSK
jgi:hypothetical protein